MKLYCYSETSRQVEESDALESILSCGIKVYRVELHGKPIKAIESIIFLTWDESPIGAVNKYIKKETKEARKHTANIMFAELTKKKLLEEDI